MPRDDSQSARAHRLSNPPPNSDRERLSLACTSASAPHREWSRLAARRGARASGFGGDLAGRGKRWAYPPVAVSRAVYSQAGRVFIAGVLRGAVDFTARRTGAIEGRKRTSQASRIRRTDAISVASSLAISVSRPMRSRNVVRITTFLGGCKDFALFLLGFIAFSLPDGCCCILDAERTGKVAGDCK
jgi:hypothetical protein